MRASFVATAIFTITLAMTIALSAEEKKDEGNLKKIADDTKYRNAVLFIDMKNYDKALMELQEYLEIYGNGIHRKEAHAHIAAIYFDRFEYRKAIRAYRALSEEFSNTEEGVEASYRTGICYLKMGNAAKASEIFKAIIDEHPDSDFSLKAKNQLEIGDLLQKESDDGAGAGSPGEVSAPQAGKSGRQ
jgi:TolA-binding protein